MTKNLSPLTNTAIHIITDICKQLYGNCYINSVKFISANKAQISLYCDNLTQEYIFAPKFQPNEQISEIINNSNNIVIQVHKIYTNCIDKIQWLKYPAKDYIKITIGGSYSEVSAGPHFTGFIGDLSLQIIKIETNSYIRELKVDFHVEEKY